MTFNQARIPFQSCAEPPWTLSNIFPEEQMDECPTCELRKDEGKNDYFNMIPVNSLLLKVALMSRDARN